MRVLKKSHTISKLKLKNTCSIAGTLKPLNLTFAAYNTDKKHTIASTLIIMHGMMGSKENWQTMCEKIFKKLNPVRKLINVDARNHGDSPHSPIHTYEALALDIKHLIQTEHLGQQVVLMGHSMGGIAMIQFTLTWPEVVEQLIIVDVGFSLPHRATEGMAALLTAMQQINILKKESLSKIRKSADHELSRQYKEIRFRQFVLTNLVQDRDGNIRWRMNVKALLANIDLMEKLPPVKAGKQYTGPTLFIICDQSIHVPTTDFDALRKVFPKAKFEVVEGAGHLVHEDKPEMFLNLVLEVLNSA